MPFKVSFYYIWHDEAKNSLLPVTCSTRERSSLVRVRLIFLFVDFKITTSTQGTGNNSQPVSGTKTDFGAENPVSGQDWNNYFKNKYGNENVQWKPASFDDIIANPERLYGNSIGMRYVRKGWIRLEIH